MARVHRPRLDQLRARHRDVRSNDRGQARTKLLAALVAVMVAAGVVSLVLVLTNGSGKSGSRAVAEQPSGSQVGRQSSTPASSTPASSIPASSTPVSSSVVATPSPKSAAPTTSSAPPAKASTSKPKSASQSAKTTKPVTYTVRKGDNLTVIASWFHQRGYGSIYDWNKSVIGKNPNLIYPGQKIIVSLTGDHLMVKTGTK